MNDFYLNCDRLEILPEANRKNWLFELDLLSKILPPNAKVLQIGCMDGTRIIALLEKRPDLLLTGLDIDGNLLKIAEENFRRANIDSELIHGDITKPLAISGYDYSVCLNNTLGYIPEWKMAVRNMAKYGYRLL